MTMMRKVVFLLVGLMLASWSLFAQADDILLGAGDVIRVKVYGSEDLTLETRISEAGVISYPLVGEVKIGGLSTAQAESKIAGLLKKGGYLVNPQVNILVTVPQSQMVSVLGQVNKPGRYPLDGKRNVADVVALAGGSRLMAVMRSPLSEMMAITSPSSWSISTPSRTAATRLLCLR
jgi:polysaccharide export outer membrane protein